MKVLFLTCILIFLPWVSFSQSWIQTLNGRSVWSLAKDVSGNIYAGGLTGTNSRIWSSTNNGTTWDTIYFGGGQTMGDFAFDSSGTIYVANFSAGLLKSTNNGANFSVIPASVFNNSNLQGVECGSSGYVFVTTSTGFYRSTDNGQTFNQTDLTGLNCLPVIVDNDSSNIIFVGVSSGSGMGVGVYRSTDNGVSFGNNLNPGKNGYNLFQKSSFELYMISTTSPYNFDKSTNKGLTWTTISNLPFAQRGITVGGFGWIYTGGNGGVFRSTDNGQTFVNYNFTTTTTPVLYVNNYNVLMVFAGTTGSTTGGVWKYIEGIIQGTSEENENFSDYSLEQNYPNPFNPVTTINYNIANSSNVTLKIYDITGKEIRSMVSQFQNKGNYSVVWNGTDNNGVSAPSGVYFYKLTSEGSKVQNTTITKKMMLIK